MFRLVARSRFPPCGQNPAHPACAGSGCFRGWPSRPVEARDGAARSLTLGVLRRVQRAAELTRRQVWPDLHVAVSEDLPIFGCADEQEASALFALFEVLFDERTSTRLGKGARQRVDRRMHGGVRQQRKETRRVCGNGNSGSIGLFSQCLGTAQTRTNTFGPLGRYIPPRNRNRVGHAKDWATGGQVRQELTRCHYGHKHIDRPPGCGQMRA